MLGALVYFLGTELFSSSSPTVIYDQAGKRVKDHPDVRALLGTPLKVYGSGRRREHPRYRGIASLFSFCPALLNGSSCLVVTSTYSRITKTTW